MPFTFAHAAAALPFRRTRLIFSAVVVGCFAPDFEYFLRLTAAGRFSHSLPGLFVFDLPAGFAILWLFHRYAKEPLWMWLPQSFRQRVRLGPRMLPIENFDQFALVLLSILVGASTHILWDSFTHPSLWVARHWHLLNQRIRLPIVGPVRYSRVFQYSSTVIGTIVLLVSFLRRPRTATPMDTRDAWNSGNERTVFMLALIVALAAGLVRAFLGLDGPLAWHRMEFIANAVVTTISVFWLEVVIYGIVRDRRRSQILVS